VDTAADAAAVKLLQYFQNRIRFALFLTLFSVPKVAVEPGIDGGVLAEYFRLIIKLSHVILGTPSINKLLQGIALW